jgi:hypothetical protein
MLQALEGVHVYRYAFFTPAVTRGEGSLSPQNIARVLASVHRNPRRSATKHAQASGMSDMCFRRILLRDLNLQYKLQAVHSLSDRDKYAYNFVVIFREYSLKIQTYRTFSRAMRRIFICIAQLINRYFDTRRLQFLTNFPLWIKSYSLLCCLVQRSHSTLLLWGWRLTSHHSHITTFQRDDQWISSPKASTKP